MPGRAESLHGSEVAALSAVASALVALMAMRVVVSAEAVRVAQVVAVKARVGAAAPACAATRSWALMTNRERRSSRRRLLFPHLAIFDKRAATFWGGSPIYRYYTGKTRLAAHEPDMCIPQWSVDSALQWPTGLGSRLLTRDLYLSKVADLRILGRGSIQPGVLTASWLDSEGSG